MIWGNPGGSRSWNGEGEVSSRATWDQGGWDHTTQEEGFQVSKEGLQGKRELEPHPEAKKAVGRTIVFEFKYCILQNHRFSHGWMSVNTDFSV